MVDTLGRFSTLNAVQLWNVWFPIDVALAKLAVTRLVQLLKATSPIVVVSGKSTLGSTLQLWNA